MIGDSLLIQFMRRGISHPTFHPILLVQPVIFAIELVSSAISVISEINTQDQGDVSPMAPLHPITPLYSLYIYIIIIIIVMLCTWIKLYIDMYIYTICVYIILSVCVYIYIYIYTSYYIHTYIYMCSRIELKMTETEQSNCIGQSAPFVMQLALRLCFCQMPIASITNGFTETLNCSGGVTRQNPPNPPERVARASKERKRRVVGGKTPLYTIKSAATTWLPKDLRWRESRSYDVLNFLKRWGHSSGHPEGPREI